MKDKRDIAVMLSNLVNDSSPQNSTKSKSLQNVSDAAKNNSASKEPSTDRIWKCNIDAMVNNTGKQLYTSKILIKMSLKSCNWRFKKYFYV